MQALQAALRSSSQLPQQPTTSHDASTMSESAKNKSYGDISHSSSSSGSETNLNESGHVANNSSDSASPFAPAPQRPSPAPQNPAVAAPPNGKPTSPAVEKAASPITTTSNSTPGAGQAVSSKDPKAAAAAANDMRNVVRRKLTGYVGFANLPNQWHRKSVRKGFNFNVMVVGEYTMPFGPCNY